MIALKKKDKFKKESSKVAKNHEPNFLAGITFGDSIAERLESDADLQYTIRLSNTKRRSKEGTGMNSFTPWDTKEVFATEYTDGPINPWDSDGGPPVQAMGILFIQIIHTDPRKTDPYIFKSFLMLHMGILTNCELYRRRKIKATGRKAL
ncbi:hypothetical protein Y032_1230g3774 [Ancylostoma ceylanicum]|uniref:Uncharacterized protein n=1 Tax=Ancylostoma ceylanicum TaxID=53326 RepID=A0A016W7H2_9BILA|nr:hypothetical protein Y032_1230g3774 [Ancylostoma ceylanicum]